MRVCVCAYTLIWARAHTYRRTNVYACMCMWLSVYVCMRVCVYVHMCVSLCAHMLRYYMGLLRNTRERRQHELHNQAQIKRVDHFNYTNPSDVILDAVMLSRH